jgi:hypothetical protein
MNAEKNPDKIPLFGSWKGWYRAVLITLAFLIVLFTFFTKLFA